LLLAVIDDFSPTAVEEHDGSVTIFFTDPHHRDRARDAVTRAWPAAAVTSREVDDENWAERSQENLGPVTVGRITVAPPWAAPRLLPVLPAQPGLPPPFGPLAVIIRPSMAFGTGHHATTRLCLVALQMMNLSGTFVLDVGTGSGVLAIAASMLGADGALGIDNDADAVQCARDNLLLNPGATTVRFAIGDLSAGIQNGPAALNMARGLQLGPPDVLVANLTGDLLRRAAPLLSTAFAPGGGLIVSGVLVEERDAVVGAFSSLDLVWEAEEEEWVGLGFARL